MYRPTSVGTLSLTECESAFTPAFLWSNLVQNLESGKKIAARVGDSIFSLSAEIALDVIHSSFIMQEYPLCLRQYLPSSNPELRESLKKNPKRFPL